jgi:hypothetical protein
LAIKAPYDPQPPSTYSLESNRPWKVPMTLAAQYGRMVEALIDAGEAGVDWRFALD